MIISLSELNENVFVFIIFTKSGKQMEYKSW